MQNKSSPASQKKLKQLRLPFQIISKTLADDKKETVEVRKRRPSEPSDESRAAKIGKIDEVKENLKDPVSSVEIISDDENPETPLTTAVDNEIPESNILSETAKPSTLRKRDKLVKNQKSTKKRKLKVVDTELDAPVEQTAELKIKLPTSTKKRNRKGAQSVENAASSSEVKKSIDIPVNSTSEVVENSDTCKKVSLESKIQGAPPKTKPDCEYSNVDAGPSDEKTSDSEAECATLEVETIANPAQIKLNITKDTEPIAEAKPLPVKNDNTVADKSSNEPITTTTIESKKRTDEISPSSNKQTVTDDTTATETDFMALGQVLPSQENPKTTEENSSEIKGREKATVNIENDKADVEEKNDDTALLINSLCSSNSDGKPDVVDAKETTKQPASTKKTGECKTPTSANKAASTPKQAQRKKEQEQRNLEKQRAKEERDRKIQEEKEQRLEKELQRKKEREEKEEQKRKEREEREEQKRKDRKDREDKLEQQRKEREEKEEQKRLEVEQKNEERKQKDEEKKKKELEAELKKKRASEAFTKFFVPKKTDPRNNSDDDSSSCEVLSSEGRLAFMPFQKKGNMRIAPPVRRNLSSKVKAELEKLLLGNDVSKENLYIGSLKKGEHVPRKSERSWQEDDDDVIIVINEMDGLTNELDASTNRPTNKRYRAKYLKFDENQRPAYYGTWRKKSSSITGRKPFALDDKLFDYEVDSDDEWEEEEPGESLHGSDDDKDKESEDDYEVDNEFMVPHGHLSDEEMDNEDEQMQDHTPETQKAKLKILQQEFVAEMKKKTEKLKPRLIGCIWVTSTNENGEAKCPETCATPIWDFLFARAMIYSNPIQFVPDKCDLAPDEQSASSVKSTQKRIDLNEHQTKDLIRLIHGSRLSRKFLATEFNAYCKHKDEKSEGFPYVQAKIKQLATWQQCPEEGEIFNKLCWYVSSETREKYNLQELSLPNTWEYILNPNQSKSKAAGKKIVATNPNEGVSATPTTTPDVNKMNEPHESELQPKIANKPDIKKFAKILTAEERQQQFKKGKVVIQAPKTEKPTSQAIINIDLTDSDNQSVPMVWFPSAKVAAPKPAATKKRVALLMSVPRGQAIPENTKKNLISNFLKGGASKTATTLKLDQPPSQSDITEKQIEPSPGVDNNNKTTTTNELSTTEVSTKMAVDDDIIALV